LTYYQDRRRDRGAGVGPGDGDSAQKRSGSWLRDRWPRIEGELSPQRYGISSSLLFRWRRLMEHDELGGLCADNVAVVVSPSPNRFIRLCGSINCRCGFDAGGAAGRQCAATPVSVEVLALLSCVFIGIPS